jgi:hypothetical protein
MFSFVQAPNPEAPSFCSLGGKKALAPLETPFDFGL